MNRLKKYLPSETLLIVYNSLFLSRLNYGIGLWAQLSAYKSKLQKKAVRITRKVKYNAHTSPLLKEFNLLKFEHLVEIHDWKFYYKLNIIHSRYIFNKIAISLCTVIFIIRKPEEGLDISNHETKYKAFLSTIKNRLSNFVNNSPDNIREQIQTHSLHGLSGILKERLSVIFFLNVVFKIATFAKHRKTDINWCTRRILVAHIPVDLLALIWVSMGLTPP